MTGHIPPTPSWLQHLLENDLLPMAPLRQESTATPLFNPDPERITYTEELQREVTEIVDGIHNMRLRLRWALRINEGLGLSADVSEKATELVDNAISFSVTALLEQMPESLCECLAEDDKTNGCLLCEGRGYLTRREVRSAYGDGAVRQSVSASRVASRLPHYVLPDESVKEARRQWTAASQTKHAALTTAAREHRLRTALSIPGQYYGAGPLRIRWEAGSERETS